MRSAAVGIGDKARGLAGHRGWEQRQQVGGQRGVAAAEAVDGLLAVTHPETLHLYQIGKFLENFELYGIRILKFIHKQVFHAAMDVLLNGGFVKQFQELGFQIIEIQQVVGSFVLFILLKPIFCNVKNILYAVFNFCTVSRIKRDTPLYVLF